ncbi:MAG: LapA family protein [Candidatus Latescibacterota bacterium]
MKVSVLIGLLVFMAILFAQNSEVVTVRFLLWESSLSRIVLLLITLAIGIIIGFVLAKLPRRRSDGK